MTLTFRKLKRIGVYSGGERNILRINKIIKRRVFFVRKDGVLKATQKK